MPSTTSEITDIIDSISATKSTTSKNAEAKFLNLSKIIIAPILANYLICTLNLVCFLIVKKLLRLCSYLKKVICAKQLTTDQLRYCLNSTKF